MHAECQKNEIVRFAVICNIFFLLFFCAQTFYTYVIKPIPLNELIDKRHISTLEVMNKGLRLENGEGQIIMFGDSVNFSGSPNETDKRKISEILAALLATEHLITVDGRAYHLGVYDSYLHYALRHGKNKPKFLIVPINLRSFTTHWILNPGWRFDDLQRYLRHAGLLYDLLYRPLKSFKVGGDQEISQAEFQQAPVFDGWKRVGQVKEFDNPTFNEPSVTRKQAKATYYYMQSIDRNNERMKQLLSFQKNIRKHKIPVLFYIGPVDYQACDALLDNRFTPQIQQNVATIRRELEKNGSSVLDLSFSLDSDGFYYRSPYPDEHLNHKGRSFVAAKIRDRMTTGLSAVQ